MGKSDSAKKIKKQIPDVFDCNKPNRCVWEDCGVVPDQVPEVPPQLLKMTYDSGLEIKKENTDPNTDQVVLKKFVSSLSKFVYACTFHLVL